MPEIVHRGPHHRRVENGCNRFTCLREKLFADEWEKVNEDEHLLALLYWMPAKPEDPKAELAMSIGMGPTHYKRVLDGDLTARDAAVAAMVIQWLGTNVGTSWLEGVLRKQQSLNDTARDRSTALAMLPHDSEPKNG